MASFLIMDMLLFMPFHQIFILVRVL